MVQERIQRYVSQSSRHQAGALRELREGHWQRAEELLWGSLVGALKAVALSRGVELKSDADMRGYLTALALETKDRRVGDAFNQLSRFSTIFYRIENPRLNPDRLHHLAEGVSYVVERLWDMPLYDGEEVD